MKISKHLPQFENEKFLIVVLGRKSGLFYFAHKSVIKKIDDFKIKAAHYSDREGFFLNAGSGGAMGSGAPLTDNSEYARLNFLKTVKERTRSLARDNDIDCIYLFSPKDISSIIVSELMPKQRKIIKEIFHGNMMKKHPDELLAKIKQIGEEKKGTKDDDLKKDAKKILSKSRKARKVVGIKNK